MQLGVGELQMPSLRQRKESTAWRGIETARRAAQLLGMQLPVPGATQEDSSISTFHLGESAASGGAVPH